MSQSAVPKRITKKEKKLKKFQEPNLSNLFSKNNLIHLEDVSDVESDADYEGEELTKAWEKKGGKPAKVESDKPARLPIKLKDGTLVKAQQEESEEDEGEEAQSDAESELKSDDETEISHGTESASKPLGKDHLALPSSSDPHFLIVAQEEIAKLCRKIISQPEEKYTLLNDLKKLFKHKDSKLRHLSYISCLAVFIDIIPSYRIRPLTEAEQTVKVSKDVKLQRQYEQALLSQYQAYLSALQHEFQMESSPLAPTIVHCFSNLLTKMGHFNFFEYIIEFIGRRLMSKKIDETYLKCWDGVKQVFEEDKLGENSLLITQALLRLMKNKNYNIPSNTIQLLSYLNLNLSTSDKVNELTQPNGGSKQKTKNGKKNKRSLAELSQHVSKKQKKKLKVDKELREELREAEAEYTREEVSKFQSETLKTVFIIYFRILKTDPPSPLIPNVLDGLIHFAHLINVDLFPDLFPYLKSLLHKQIPSSSPSLHPDLDYLKNRLKCIHCCFKLLNDEIIGLNLDLKPFYDELYCILINMGTLGGGGYGEISQEIGDHMIQCLSSALVEGVKTSNVRSMAFLKRLITVSFQLEEPLLLRLLQLIKQFIIKYPQTLTLFTNNGEVLGDGKYLAEAEDPDLSNPIVTTVAELVILQNHFSPKVGQQVREIFKLSKRINQ